MSVNPRPLVANIYNPHNQSKAELVAGFVVRKKFFEKIFRDIQTSTMQNPEQHYIIQGLRGMGKTTMLLRIAYEIESTESLKNWLIPVVFNEEEYGISSLSDLWERVAELLEENSTEFLGLYDKIAIHTKSDDYERLALDIIIKTLQANQKKIILLIDNIGDILKKFDERDEQRLREVLMSIPEIRLIGATSIFLENLFDYKRPFFDFFRYQYLEGLTKEEALDLMLKLGEIFHEESIKNIVENEPHRVEILRRLTGGVVRTMVLLFEIFVENNTGSAFKDLEILIDRVTPLYKSRMDDLPKQQQKIVASLANFWEAATAKELAESVRMESKVVSAQLQQLIKNRVVTKIETNTKNHLYRLEERFFNIWYLMRFGRKTDQRILWLVKFMEEFIAGDEPFLLKRINGHLSAIDNATLDPKAALYLTEAFAQMQLVDREMANSITQKTRNYLIDTAPSLVNELSNSVLELREQADRCIEADDFVGAIECLKGIKNKELLEYVEIAGLYSMLDDQKQANHWFELCLKIRLKISEKLIQKEFDKLSEKELKKLFLCMNMDFVKKWNTDIEAKIIALMIGEHYNKLFCFKLNLYHFDVKNTQFTDFDGYNYINCLIWNDEFDTLSNISNDISVNEFNESFVNIDSWNFTTKLLLAKKQFHLAKNFYEYLELEKSHFIYAVIIYFLKNEYPTEYLKMPPEMKETVEDLVKEIEQMAIDYA
jgi:hypothetical protein